MSSRLRRLKRKPTHTHQQVSRMTDLQCAISKQVDKLAAIIE